MPIYWKIPAPAARMRRAEGGRRRVAQRLVHPAEGTKQDGCVRAGVPARGITVGIGVVEENVRVRMGVVIGGAAVDVGRVLAEGAEGAVEGELELQHHCLGAHTQQADRFAGTLPCRWLTTDYVLVGRSTLGRAATVTLLAAAAAAVVVVVDVLDGSRIPAQGWHARE